MVNINTPPSPCFSDVWQPKDFKSFRFGSVANARVTGGFFGSVARKELRCVFPQFWRSARREVESKPLALKVLRCGNGERVDGEGGAIIMAHDTRGVN